MVPTSDDDAANSCQGHLAEAGGSVSEALNTEECHDVIRRGSFLPELLQVPVDGDVHK